MHASGAQRILMISKWRLKNKYLCNERNEQWKYKAAFGVWVRVLPFGQQIVKIIKYWERLLVAEAKQSHGAIRRSTLCEDAPLHFAVNYYAKKKKQKQKIANVIVFSVLLLFFLFSVSLGGGTWQSERVSARNVCKVFDLVRFFFVLLLLLCTSFLV